MTTQTTEKKATDRVIARLVKHFDNQTKDGTPWIKVISEAKTEFSCWDADLFDDLRSAVVSRNVMEIEYSTQTKHKADGSPATYYNVEGLRLATSTDVPVSPPPNAPAQAPQPTAPPASAPAQSPLTAKDSSIVQQVCLKVAGELMCAVIARPDGPFIAVDTAAQQVADAADALFARMTGQKPDPWADQ